jgi:predicted nucleotidyltransferase
VNSIRGFLHALASDGLESSFGVLFGSQVTGKADKWSDIDLVVVSPRFDAGIRREDVDRLWITASLTDSRIEPVPCGEREWVEDDSRAIIEIARREGVIITPN